MARKRPGMGEPGRERIRRNWDAELGGWDTEPTVTGEPSWLVGAPSASQMALREEIAATNLAEKQFMDTEHVQTLKDLWPNTENYEQGPTQSTRVSRHRFVPNKATGLTGTMYVEFTNMRKDGTVRRTNVYKYNKVPYSAYRTFSTAKSKGSFFRTPSIRIPAPFKFDNLYSYERIDDTSVFND